MKRTNTAVWLEKYNRWQIKVQKDGERRTFTSSIPGRNGQREANRKADAWLEDGIQKRMRCGVLLDYFLENIKERTSSSNYRNEESRVRLYIKPVINNMWVDSLNDAVLQSIIDSQAKHLSKKSLQTLRATTVAFVKFCRKNKWTSYIPDDITIPKAAPIGKHNIIQPKDLKILFSVDTTLSNGARVKEKFINAYRFQVLTGLRPGEIMGLMWSDIVDGYVCLQRSINISNEVTRGKNENAIRSFKLTDSAKEILSLQPKTSIYIFSIPYEKVYREHLKRYCIANGIPPVTPYELRHTFVSMAQQLPEGLVKSIVGHSKNMDTFGVYGHAVAGYEDIAADKLQSVIDKILLEKPD